MTFNKALLAKAAVLVVLIAACAHVPPEARADSAPASAAGATTPAAPAPMATSASGAAILPPGAAVPDALLEGPGKAIVLARCGVCHHPNIVTTAHHTDDEWRELVGQMIARGAMVPDEDYDGLIAYLVKTYPPQDKP